MRGILKSGKVQARAGDHGGITRIVIRYADGREMNFVPDAERSIFSEDDILELKKLLSKASATSEWAEMSTRQEY
ncbi:MAG: hypothetical protein AB1425_06515 [Actinomycetota bacterium]